MKKKSIDFHIGIPLKKKDIKKLGFLLKFLKFNEVELPLKWKKSGLKWFQIEKLQIQLIPETFQRNDSNKTLNSIMTTIPHVAFSVKDFPTKEILQKCNITIIDGPLLRPDGLEQLYLLIPSNSFFIELNKR